MAPTNKEKERKDSDQEPFDQPAKGTNIEPGIKDSIRMPGTQWCGKGWRVDAAVSMGGYAGADRCCRHHDLACPISIESGKTKYGLTNGRSIQSCTVPVMRDSALA